MNKYLGLPIEVKEYTGSYYIFFDDKLFRQIPFKCEEAAEKYITETFNLNNLISKEPLIKHANEWKDYIYNKNPRATKEEKYEKLLKMQQDLFKELGL